MTLLFFAFSLSLSMSCPLYNARRLFATSHHSIQRPTALFCEKAKTLTILASGLFRFSMAVEELGSKKRVREESDDLEPVLPEVKKIKDDLLGFLDDSDPDPAAQDLDYVMKSFEKEISASSSPVTVVDLTSESGDSQPELGYLLEASDDELGLPPSSISSNGNEVKREETELVRVDSAESSGIGELWRFEDEIPSYDSFGLGAVGSYNAEYLAYDDGLFDYSNFCYDSSEPSDYSWRLGSMPAE